MAKAYVTGPVEGLNHQSAAETLSLINSDMEVFRDFVNDFESEMACKRQSKPRRKTCS